MPVRSFSGVFANGKGGPEGEQIERSPAWASGPCNPLAYNHLGRILRSGTKLS